MSTGLRFMLARIVIGKSFSIFNNMAEDIELNIDKPIQVPREQEIKKITKYA
jgi:hypothetical protein